jgi:hypothetical protein
MGSKRNTKRNRRIIGGRTHNEQARNAADMVDSREAKYTAEDEIDEEYVPPSDTKPSGSDSSRGSDADISDPDDGTISNAAVHYLLC